MQQCSCGDLDVSECIPPSVLLLSGFMSLTFVLVFCLLPVLLLKSVFFLLIQCQFYFFSLDSGIVLTCVYYIYFNSVCFVWHWVKNNKHMNIIEKSIHPCPQVVGVVWAARPCLPQPPPCPTFPGGGKVPKLAKRCNHSSVSLVCPGASSRGLFPVWHVQNTSSRRCPGGILVRCPNCLTPFVVEDEQLYSEWPWPVSKARRS